MQTKLFNYKDTKWLVIWLSVIIVTGIWNLIFLNKPAFTAILKGYLNTVLIALMVVFFTLIYSWIITLGMHFFKSKKIKIPYLIITFFMNLIRSIPQIIGILLGMVFIVTLTNTGIISGNAKILVLISSVMSIFIFPEMVDLMQDRISHFKKLDFYNAMLVCGISENRIINFNILWSNSKVHILNKLISVFGMAVFLQCSVDFIISVGLSSNLSSVDFPTTLGNLLASTDSKQDILAIGYTLTHPLYFGNLFLTHLLGITVAFLIVFTLMSIYFISNGFAERNRL